MKAFKLPFRVKRPCHRCPFRRDVRQYLTRNRTVEIAATLQTGNHFLCHNTLKDDNAESAHCAGALLLQRKAGIVSDAAQVAMRLGIESDIRRRIPDSDVVYGSLREFAESGAK